MGKELQLEEEEEEEWCMRRDKVRETQGTV